MGGGGAMRAAAKVGAGSAWGIVSGEIRRGGGAPNFNPAGVFWPVSPVFVSSSSPEAEVKKPGKEAPVQSGSVEPVTRLVVGPVPTLKEAQEATSELKEALDHLYILSPTMVCRVPGNSITTDAAPNNAIRAFKLFSQSIDVQTAVASLACDPQVMKAVLNNPAVLEYIESQRSTVTHFQDMDNESVSDSGPGLADVMHSIKLKVLKMVSSVSEILQSIFGPSVTDHEEEADGNTTFSADDIAYAAPLLGLALVVMMVVLLKRA